MSKMKLVEITDEMLEEAKKRALEIPKDLKNSILKGQGNVVSFIGQMAVEKLTGATKENTYNWDIKLNEKKCEVKSKKRTVPPRENYECSVTNANTKQKCDYYVFVIVLDDLKKAWVLGYLEKEEYYKKAVFLKKGQLDPSNNYTVKADCWNVKIQDLKDITELYE